MVAVHSYSDDSSASAAELHYPKILVLADTGDLSSVAPNPDVDFYSNVLLLPLLHVLSVKLLSGSQAGQRETLD